MNSSRGAWDSRAVGEDLPGRGAILLEHRVRYLAPTYMNDTITGELTVTKVRRDKPVITLAVRISRSDETLVADGEVIVLMREPKALKPIPNDVGTAAGITADAMPAPGATLRSDGSAEPPSEGGAQTSP